jgi:hypothetical protein
MRPQRGNSVAAMGRRLFPSIAVAVAGAAVWIVSWEVADELPGMSEDGAKMAVAPAGRPLAARVTVPGKAPFCAATVMAYWAEPPALMVWEAVVLETVKVGAAVELPVRVAVWGEPEALSET